MVFNLYNNIEHHPLDYDLSLKFECKTDMELIKENPVIELGGIVVVKTSNGSVFGYKIGDGKTPYTSLPFVNTNDLVQPSIQEELQESESMQLIDGGTSQV